ncbi:WD repeat-containing protein 18-like [Clytia hemisphaerica]
MEVGLFSDTSGEQSCVSVYNLSTGVVLKTFKNGSCGRKGLALVQNEYLLAVQHAKQLIHIYDMEKESLMKKIVCSEKINAIAVTPDGHFVVAALKDQIHIWQFSSGQLYCVLSRHFQDIVGIEFTEDGKYFVSYGQDNLIIVWDLNNVLQSCMSSPNSMTSEQRHKPVHVLSNHSMSVEDLNIGVGSFRANMVSCSLDQTCKIFEVSSGKLLKNFVFDVGCTSVAMDTCEKLLFVGMADGRIAIINCYDQKQSVDAEVTESCYMKAHKKAINCLSVSLDGQHLISGSKDCFVKIWHISSRKCIRSFEFKEQITNVQLKPAFLFNNNYNNNTSNSCKRTIGNFQRSVYTPTTYKDTNEMFSASSKMADNSDTIPMVLRDINDNEEGYQEPKSCLEDVLREFYYSKQSSSSSTEDENNTASREELQQRVASLEAMTQELYKASTNKLLQTLKENSMETSSAR